MSGEDISKESFDSEDVNVEEGGTSPDEPEENTRFSITSFGWAPDAEGLVKRMTRGDIFIPGYQRNYVWNNSEKSSFVESLILGLPVPSIFLAQDSDDNTLNVVDGQQRLASLKEYFDGEFPLSGKGIQEDLKGRYFDSNEGKRKKYLSEADSRALTDAVISTVVMQPAAADDDPHYGREYNRAVVQVFKRLNTTGKPLQAQEIRSSVFHGPFNEALADLNTMPEWRELFGSAKEHVRLKDIEAILRYQALRDSSIEYKSPMSQFLDNYMDINRNMSSQKIVEHKEIFSRTVRLVIDSLGASIFKPANSFILSHFDAVMVGIADALANSKQLTKAEVQNRYRSLVANKEFNWSVEEFVNDKNRVDKRIELSKNIFGA